MQYLPPAAVIFAAILWSFDGLLRQSLYSAPSFLVISVEHFLGTLLFLPVIILRWKDIRGLSKREWLSVLWVSVCGGILGTFLYTKALSYVGYIDLSVVVLLQKFQPIFAILLATIVLRERLSKRFLGIVFIALVGGYLVTFRDLTPVLSLDSKTVMGALLALGAAFCWGTSTVFGKYALQNRHFYVITALRLLVTSVIAFVILLFLGQQSAAASLTAEQWKSLLLIVFTTGSVALCIYYYGLKRIPASHATLYELFWPLSAIVLDYFIRGTVLTPTQWLGAVILLVAILRLPKRTLDAPLP